MHKGELAMQQPVSLEAACKALPQLWSPRVVGRVNDQYIKAVRVQGEFPWHTHKDEDEMFLVLRGTLRVFVVPSNDRQNTSAAEETWLALIETVTTKHTGEQQTSFTRSIEDQLEPVHSSPV